MRLTGVSFTVEDDASSLVDLTNKHHLGNGIASSIILASSVTNHFNQLLETPKWLEISVIDVISKGVLHVRNGREVQLLVSLTLFDCFQGSDPFGDPGGQLARNLLGFDIVVLVGIDFTRDHLG